MLDDSKPFLWILKIILTQIQTFIRTSKSLDQVRAYWAKFAFTGKGTPPQIADRVDELAYLLTNDPE